MYRFLRLPLVLALSLAILEGGAQKISFHEVKIGVESSFRGLSVVDDSIAWVCGNNGIIGRTQDAGATWEFMKIESAMESDFRSIHAFSYREAVVANAGSPASIYKTDNGGDQWEVVYRNTNAKAFINSIAFTDYDHGFAIGDPINGKLMVLESLNGGQAWQPIEKEPMMSPDEFVFAASGTTLRAMKDGTLLVGTGGAQARLLISGNFGSSWKTLAAPVIDPNPSSGIFSVWISDNGRIVAVGGDYKREQLAFSNSWTSNNGGKSWQKPGQFPGGYRSCVEQVGRFLVAIGPSGGDISGDGGLSWQPFIGPGGNVIRTSPDGKLTLMAGKNRIWKVNYDH